MYRMLTHLPQMFNFLYSYSCFASYFKHPSYLEENKPSVFEAKPKVTTTKLGRRNQTKCTISTL